MKRLYASAAACLLLGLGLGAGCGSEGLAPERVAVRGGGPATTFEAYLAEHVRPSPDGQGYLVEGDMYMPDLERVRRHFAATTPGAGALAVWRPGGNESVWSAVDRWNLTYCIRPGDFGAQYGRVVEFMHKAASGWENAADVRFVHRPSLDTSACTRTSGSVKFNVERDAALGAGASMGFPTYPRSLRFLALGITETWSDARLLAVLIHELGHALGFVHEQDTAPGCSYVTTSGASDGYRQLTCYDGRGALHYTDVAGWLDLSRPLNFISQWDVEGAQSIYGAPTNVLNTADGTVYARQRATGDLYKRVGAGWTKVGDRGHAFVAVGNTLYGQTPVDGVPVRYTGAGWVAIGGPAGQIFACLGTLCATVPDTGDVAKYDAGAGTWTVIGGPGSRFQSTGTQLFGIGPWQDDYVARYGGSGTSWSVVGGGASELFGGGTSMYRLTNSKNAIQRHDGGSTWTTIGGPGRQFQATAGSVYGLSPDGGGIFKYAVTQWSGIHGPAARLFGSAGALFATSASDETIEQYNAATNTWTSLGKP